MHPSNRTGSRSGSRSCALLAALFAFAVAVPALAAEEVYSIDPVHSNVSFRIRHLTAKVTGAFMTYTGEIRLDRADLSKGSVTFEIETASINTNNTDRDNHLRSPDFFEAEKHPKITFKSTKVTVDKDDPNRMSVDGMLAMKGVSKPVSLKVELGGFVKDPWGNEKAGFDVTGRLNRKDYGILWNKALDAGGFVLGDDVDVMISLEAAKKKEPAPETKKAEEGKKG